MNKEHLKTIRHLTDKAIAAILTPWDERTGETLTLHTPHGVLSFSVTDVALEEHYNRLVRLARSEKGHRREILEREAQRFGGLIGRKATTFENLYPNG